MKNKISKWEKTKKIEKKRKMKKKKNMKNEKMKIMKKKKKMKKNRKLLMCINVMTTFSLRDSNQRTACARSVWVSPHVCCQVYKVQVSVSNIVSDATGSRVHTTSIHKHKNVSLVPCPTLLNTVPTHFTHGETQRVATNPFHQQKHTKKRKTI